MAPNRQTGKNTSITTRKRQTGKKTSITTRNKRPKIETTTSNTSGKTVDIDFDSLPGFVDAQIAKSKKASEKAFQRLNTFLRSRGISAEQPEQPYKLAILKLLDGEITDEKVREQIAKYIVLNLGGVKKLFLELFRTPDTDKEVASCIAEYTKEVMEHVGVEVIELKEIIAVAEEVCNESFERSVLARGRFLRNCVCNWLANTDFHGETAETVREWVKNPTASFRSCVVRGYNDFYDRGGRFH